MKIIQPHPIKFLVTLLVLVSCWLPGQMGFASTQVGNVLLNLPTGWQTVNQSNMTVLVPAGKTPDTSDVVIAITPGIDLNGADFKTIFNTIVQGLDAKDTVIKRSDVASLDTGKGYTALTQVTFAKQPDGSQLIKAYVATNPGDRLEMLLFITTSEAALKQYQPIFSNLVDSMAFANMKNGQPLAARKPHPAFTYTPPQRSTVRRPNNSNPFATPHFNGFDAYNGGAAFNAFKSY